MQTGSLHDFLPLLLWNISLSYLFVDLREFSDCNAPNFSTISRPRIPLYSLRPTLIVISIFFETETERNAPQSQCQNGSRLVNALLPQNVASVIGPFLISEHCTSTDSEGGAYHQHATSLMQLSVAMFARQRRCGACLWRDGRECLVRCSVHRQGRSLVAWRFCRTLVTEEWLV